VHPAGGAAAGSEINFTMIDATNSQTKMEEGRTSEPTGPLFGLATRDDPVPKHVDWKGIRSFPLDCQESSMPPVGPDGYYLLWRRQYKEGIIEDRWIPYETPPDDDVLGPPVNLTFKGWLKGFKAGVKKFFYRASPGGPMELVMFQRAAREYRDIEIADEEDSRRRYESDGDLSVPLGGRRPMSFEETLCRTAERVIVLVL